MKKKLFIFASALCIGISVYASAEFRTSCGYVGTTVAPEAFETIDEYVNYINDLNVIYCGEEGNVSVPRIQRVDKLK